jgi:hypothetical protein
MNDAVAYPWLLGFLVVVGSDARGATEVTACETSLARMNTNVEIDPPATRPVATVPLFDPSTLACVSP